MSHGAFLLSASSEDIKSLFQLSASCSIGPRWFVAQSNCYLEVPRDEPSVKVLPQKAFSSVDAVCQTAKSSPQRKPNLRLLFTHKFVTLKHFSFPYNNRGKRQSGALSTNQYFQDIIGKSKERIHMIKRGDVACSNNMWHY